MRFQPSLTRLLIVVLAAALPIGVAAQGKGAPGTGSPLTLQATCDARGPAPVLRVQLANASEHPSSVVLGFHPPKDKAQVVNSVQVVAIRPATGADENYVYVHPKYALTKGDPWVVTLPPGGTREMELPLGDFISSMTYTPLDPGVAPGARLVFEGRRGAKGGPQVWTGNVETVLKACM